MSACNIKIFDIKRDPYQHEYLLVVEEETPPLTFLLLFSIDICCYW